MSLLETRGLTAFYGDFQALFGVDLVLEQGEIVAVIGANGAGKTTLLRSVAGLNPTGSQAVRFDGEAIGGMAAYRVARRGIALVPEGRKLFPSLTVEENLLVGARTGRAGGWNLERVYALFPSLAQRRAHLAQQVSGGEQQMAAIGRALMGNPRLLLCDEVSLGLAPLVVNVIYQAFRALSEDGVSLVVVEQDIGTALAAADRVYCLQHGRVSLNGRPSELARERISRAYFGI
ncbi:MAG TPA: ABC transporter ATP-binding protein [Burkholderiales bacterium]|nr:ABC transporter ATP-binding protein [Burkholderiales bacterium]